MSEENQMQDASQETQAPDAAPQYDEAVAELAKSRGWKPPEEWVGDRSNLIEDPNEFNALYEERMPSMLRENRNLRNEISALRAEFESLADWRNRMEEANAKQLERERESLKSQLKQAVDAGDQRLAEQIIARRDELQATQQVKPKPADPNADPAFQSWINSDDADWYRKTNGNPTDPKVAVGIQIAEQLHAQGMTPKSAGVTYYQELSRRVKEAFPELKQVTAQVEGGSRQPAKPRPKKVESWSQLPADVRSNPTTNSIVSRMYMKAAGGDIEKARNLYAKDYQKRQEA